MLSSIQHDVALLIAEVNGRDQFVLAGGAALIFKKISRRQTEDLDYFTRDRAFVNTFATRCIEILSKHNFEVKMLRNNDGFVKINVTDGKSSTIIDFGHDHFISSDLTELGPTLTTLELGANKVLALSARALSRDAFDLYSLSKTNSLDDFIEHAPKIDPGFTIDQLVRGLEKAQRYNHDESGFSQNEWNEISEWIRLTLRELEN